MDANPFDSHTVRIRTASLPQLSYHPNTELSPPAWLMAGLNAPDKNGWRVMVETRTDGCVYLSGDDGAEDEFTTSKIERGGSWSSTHCRGQSVVGVKGRVSVSEADK